MLFGLNSRSLQSHIIIDGVKYRDPDGAEHEIFRPSGPLAAASPKNERCWPSGALVAAGAEHKRYRLPGPLAATVFVHERCKPSSPLAARGIEYEKYRPSGPLAAAGAEHERCKPSGSVAAAVGTQQALNLKDAGHQVLLQLQALSMRGAGHQILLQQEALNIKYRLSGPLAATIFCT